MSVAVKICGVCTAADAAMADAAGADYIGVILSRGFRRSRSLDEAAGIFGATRTRRVGVFVDAEVGEMVDAAARLRLDVVQLHGRESVDVIRRLPQELRVWKTVAVRTPADLQRAQDYEGVAHGLLLEGGWDRGAGGVGAGFDWAAVAPQRARLPRSLELIVAGGLNPDNVARAVALLRPDTVDVSSGVEESLGRKSAERTQAFITAARGAGVLEGS